MGKKKKRIKELEQELAKTPFQPRGYSSGKNDGGSSVSDVLKSQSGPSMYGDAYNYKGINSCGPSMNGNTGLERIPEIDSGKLDVNLKSIFLLSKYVIPIMIKGGGGSIINTGSGWGIRGGPKAVAYCAAKGGVVNMTRAMAIDHGMHGIRVNCICPGDVDTPLLRGESKELGIDEETFMKEAAERPLNRVGSPQDIANAVLFLASDLSTWVTGTSIIVDGGGLA